jgi:hypothetical protein
MVAPRPDEARRVFAMEKVGELPRQCRPRDASLFGNFVATAPENYTGVVSIAADKVDNIPLVPRIKVQVVIVWFLAALPAVKHLVHHQESPPVTGI